MIMRERIGTEIGLVTGRLKRSFFNGRDHLSNAKTTVSEKTRRAARKTDYYVHDNAWKMLGIAVGLAFAAGILISGSKRKRIAPSDGASDSEGFGADNGLQPKVKRLNAWGLLQGALPLGLILWKAVQASRSGRKG